VSTPKAATIGYRFGVADPAQLAQPAAVAINAPPPPS